ncbi:phenylalanine--tRNA ligase beta subunit-related protein, partial [Singulisphaera rosea]
MIVSWNWLTQYVRLDMPVETLTDRLALTGLNHESTSLVGEDLAIDLEVTSNRPDCLGHLGIAREIAVVFGKRFAPTDPHPPTSGPSVETRTSVTVEDPELCPRFTARVITGATVGESPWWLRKRLETIGVRPISNIVDVTNYVMFECGQKAKAKQILGGVMRLSPNGGGAEIKKKYTSLLASLKKSKIFSHGWKPDKTRIRKYKLSKFLFYLRYSVSSVEKSPSLIRVPSVAKNQSNDPTSEEPRVMKVRRIRPAGLVMLVLAASAAVADEVVLVPNANVKNAIGGRVRGTIES